MQSCVDNSKIGISRIGSREVLSCVIASLKNRREVAVSESRTTNKPSMRPMKWVWNSMKSPREKEKRFSIDL